MFNNQSAGFGCCFESLIVIGVSTGTILHTVDVIVIMNHFVKEGCYHELYASTYGSRT